MVLPAERASAPGTQFRDGAGTDSGLAGGCVRGAGVPVLERGLPGAHRGEAVKKLVSFGCPSRRARELYGSIASIVNWAGDDRLSEIEIIIHVHDDDPETLKQA